MLLRCANSLWHLDSLRKFSKSTWLLQSHSFSDAPFAKSKLAPLQERKMVDRFRLWAKGGDGGNGCTSFRRSRHERRGKPDGGKGGRGGDVILECSPALWDLSSLQHHINAKRGGHGTSKNKIGSRGEDKVVQVPVGTVIHLVGGETPSLAEKSSSKALDPWEIPGTLEVDPSESTQQSTSTNTIGAEVVETMDFIDGSSFCTGKTVMQSSSVKQATQASLIKSLPRSSPSCKKYRARTEGLNSWKEEEQGVVEWKCLEADGDMSEAECEEELEEDEHIQYNIAELTEPGQRVVVACGGEGGLGNVSTPKGPKNYNLMKHGVQRDDEFDVEESESLCIGSPGSEVVLVLELKSIADVGLVGMPNAGKSTLLGAISRAKPTVGHYAFTTLRPNLGNLNYDDFSFTVADIPGLIRGAHENRGLGHAFLRHIERTKVLAYVLDLAAALDGGKGIPPWEQLKDLILELEFYREGLSDRPCMVVANKIDEAGAEEVYEELKRRLSGGVPIFPVCAVLEEGIEEVKDGLRMLFSGNEPYRLRLDDIRVD
ncbi:probable GTP-binding protein OBGM, mitochondrial [Cornus florida]|uniref:probable GTP-binding protein OBGM, mitochondrial n=1 Tax=Cornus florida TaxID=4283 RepID=UPI00289C8243|nr:probable GTP-binding protein OBGM, mitochondrial [Cornus florida]XP_059626620.1 probable GTP-binding protein OBGM, mitochondrial [Cornus florida]XP_059626621.1 probable GTP-binding protein OBGM, mitochondrial [Cornus florida]XP_059626622.1 probable GTP-binding protein OBGM, mitochondrial [Cornus florida]